MNDPHKPALRIDWFDGTLVEDSRPNITPSTSQFADDELSEPTKSVKPQYDQKKPIGFKKLLDLSYQNPPGLVLEITNKNSFWMLMNEELKNDYIVLIVKIIAKLYKSLESDETSLLKILLKTKFQKSNFMTTLKQYIPNLPSVRVVEKCMNSLLWDDVESFYSNVLCVCQGIFKVSGNEMETWQQIYELVEIIEVSALGVREEHSERLSEDLFTKINKLKDDILTALNEDSLQDCSINEDKINNVDHFRHLHIFPNKNDLLNQNQIKIKPNIINGAYPNVEEYLDLQFKLLREDYFAPLRDGICNYLKNPSRRRFENIRVHPKVRIIHTYVSNNKVGHLVDIAWSNRISQTSTNRTKHAYNKQLMFGSLLLFTSDNFNTILSATVLDSNLNLLRNGYVAVSFQSPVSKSIYSEAYLMVESEVFFEPYHRVLKVLQNSKIEELPMQKYIVEVKPDTSPPAYLSTETMYSIKQSRHNVLTFPVLDFSKWPSPNKLGLDDTQMEAFKLALTREFAVIQGPPGTGKTYIGVKIASTLLKNLSLEGTPMLIICYTNHALDQFLESIIGITTNIVRLGSQSKSQLLQPYTLNNMRMRKKSKYSYLYASKREELELLYKEMMEVQSEVEKCEDEIICYESIKSYLNVTLEDNPKEDPVLVWLFGDLEEILDSKKPNQSIGKKNYGQSSSTKTIVTCFSEKWVAKELESLKTVIEYVEGSNLVTLENTSPEFDRYISKIKQRFSTFKKYRNINKGISEDLEEDTVDPYSFTTEERWKLYFKAVKVLKDELDSKMRALMVKHNACSEELEEVATLLDVEVMKTARVVGVTTSAAARRHRLLTRLHSPIVIVEEAAEVLEAHIVASLTSQCQHVILIGDHKQLRPTAAHYKLAKHYNLEISLFERMIRNGVHARTLTTQRRMRPDFAALLVPIIYDRLESHPDVYKYPNVRGMANNMFFFTHELFEDLEGSDDSLSHKNTEEANWCVALAEYLRKMNYQPDDVIILTTYTGQANTIKELSKRHYLLRDVKITVVDSYQGEESRIVILSLVRSNRDGNIGFLSAANRICVALSRAKEGLYIFGNMNLLKSASPIWEFINDKLENAAAIGGHLTLQCEEHHGNTLDISKSEDLFILSGTCLCKCQEKNTMLTTP